MSKTSNKTKNKTKNKITVVIPNYKGIRYLKNCLESLCRQESGTPEFEVLVVDNASGDGSIEQARKLEEDRALSGDDSSGLTKIRFICLKKNTGFCHAVNVGIRQSDTPYIILLNNDTVVKCGFVKGLYQAIEKDPKVFSVSARMLMWDRPGMIDDAGDIYTALGWAYALGKGKPAAAYDTPRCVFSACGGAAIYRRGVFRKIGLFDERHFAYLEDLDIGYRARIYGYRNLYEPTAQVLHYGSASTGSRYNEFKTKLAAANSVYVIYKNMPLAQIIWNMPFLIPGFVIKWLFFCKKGMGKIYLEGLRSGISRCCGAGAKKHKVRFTWAHLGNYLMIQAQLYKNLFELCRML